jgi:hypothetical protein
MKILNWLKQRRRMIIALIIYFITCVTLYMVEYRIYEGTIKINFINTCIILPIAYFVGWLSRDEDKPVEKKKPTIWSNVGIFFSYIFFFLFTLFFIYRLYKNIYEFVAYHYLALMLILAIIHFSKILERLKQINSTSVSIIFGTLLITTLLYVIILNPITAKDATLKVQNYGFSDVSYENNIKNQKSLSTILGTEITESSKYEDSLGYYLLKGVKDKKYYAIVVSVTNGTIVVIEEVKNNNTFRYLLDIK